MIKSKKKGILGGLALKWAAGIIIILVIIFIVLGPKQLLASVRDAAFFFGAGLTPEEQAPEFSGPSRIPKDFDNKFDNFVSTIKNFKNQKNCLIDIKEFPREKGFIVGLYTDKIQIEKLDTQGLRLADKTESISGLKPCVVKDSAAVNFYKCYIKNDKPSCSNVFKDQNVQLGDTKYLPFLFKSDKGNTCLIQGYNDVWGNCNAPKENGKEGIDSDCINDLKNNPGICTLTGEPDRIYQKIVKQEAIKFANNFKRVINSKSDCHVVIKEMTNFQKEENEIILEIKHGEEWDTANFYYKDVATGKNSINQPITEFKLCDRLGSLGPKKTKLQEMTGVVGEVSSYHIKTKGSSMILNTEGTTRESKPFSTYADGARTNADIYIFKTGKIICLDRNKELFHFNKQIDKECSK